MSSRITRNCRDLFRLFRRDHSGSIAIESALLLPVFVLILFGSVSLFQVLRIDAAYTHAATTVGDLLTRKTQIDATGRQNLYTAAAALIPAGTDFKVVLTSVRYDADKKKHVVDWSKSNKDDGEFDDDDLQPYTFPQLGANEAVIMVNIQGAVSPFFIDKFVQTINIQKLSIRRPRFVLKIDEA